MKGGEVQAAISRSLYLKGEEKQPEEPETPLSTENESSEFVPAEPDSPLLTPIEWESGKDENLQPEPEPEPESKKTESGWFEEL